MVLRHNQPPVPASFGYNLFDPAQTYRAAVEAAVDSGQPVATAPLRLAADRDKPMSLDVTAVVVRLASYRNGTAPTSVSQRRDINQGVVGIAFRSQAMISSVVPADLTWDNRIWVIDSDAQQAGTPSLLYDSQPGRPLPALSTHQAGPSQTLQVANRTWMLQVQPLQTLAWWQGMPLSTWLLLAVGAALSLSLAVMTRLLVRSNQVAQLRIAAGTAQLQQEQRQLAQVEQRFRLLYDHTLDAVLSTQPDGTVISANPAACRLFGRSEEELTQVGRLGMVDADDPRLPVLLAQRAATGYATGQLRMRRADGSVFEADISSTRFVDDAGQASTSLIVRDITQRLALEHRLRESQKLEAIGTLAGGVAHDFNNVLTAILGNAEFVAQDLPPEHPAQVQLARIRQAGQRARGLVQQILTFSRRSPQELAVQSLGPLVRESVDLLRSTLPASVRLDLLLPEAPLYALIDATQVQQLVMNLCTNAWQALPDQTGRIGVSLGEQLIAPAQGQPAGLVAGRYACLQVDDDGRGMDAATQARIFDPFFTTKALGEGTGLGLAVVHGIVLDSGGAVTVRSQLGQGSSFKLYLPLVQAPAEGSVPPTATLASTDPATPMPAAPASSSAPAKGSGQHVLYVDDDEVVALTVEMQLRRAGYQVTLCPDATSALATLAAPGCDVALVVSDFNMPGLSGLGLARQLRTDRPGLPVILCSGLVTEALLSEAQRLGVFAVLQKEHSLERLAPLVAQALTTG
jgi:PAS domain S-box-containing protein